MFARFLAFGRFAVFTVARSADLLAVDVLWPILRPVAAFALLFEASRVAPNAADDFVAAEPSYRHHRVGLDLILADLENTPLEHDKKLLARGIVKDVYDYLIDNDMTYALAALQILAETRTMGPDKYKIRKDGNSSYTHECSQVYYAIWMAIEREKVLKRYVDMRAASGTVTEDDIQTWRARLNEEYDAESLDIRIAMSLIHDLGEDYGLNGGGLARRLAHLTNRPLNTPALRMIKRGFDALTRLRTREGAKEPVQMYMQRVTSEWWIALAKARDSLHNNATLLRADMPTEKIKETLLERQLFIRLVETKLKGQSIALDYTCAYLKDQNALLVQALDTDLTDTARKDILVAEMDKLRKGYRESWIPPAIHPMICIVERIQEAMNDNLPMCNPPATGQDLAPVRSVPPSADQLRPRAA